MISVLKQAKMILVSEINLAAWFGVTFPFEFA